jgi:outer membrane protein OmpA-like peptidoglycan-associated protein
MAAKWFRIGVASLALCAAGCAPKPAAAPPAPAPTPPPPAKQNVFVLLPDPDGRPGGITVGNSSGAQSLGEPYQAVRVERSDLAPSAPFAMDQAEVRRRFGAELDVLPSREVQFTLYFLTGTETLTAESQAQLPAIFDAIRERHSTDVAVTGHTDTTGDPASNYQLGLRRAQMVASLLIARGLGESDLFVASHGEADLLVKTARGVAEQRNRRVEVIVR